MVAELSLRRSAHHASCRRSPAFRIGSRLRALPAAAFHYITPALVQIPPVGVNPGTSRTRIGAASALCSSTAMPTC